MRRTQIRRLKSSGITLEHYPPSIQRQIVTGSGTDRGYLKYMFITYFILCGMLIGFLLG
jgi:hypothetical protein